MELGLEDPPTQPAGERLRLATAITNRTLSAFLDASAGRGDLRIA